MQLTRLVITESSQHLSIDEWQLVATSYGIIGAIDSNKHLLFRAFNGDTPFSGQILDCPASIAEVSFDEQQRLVARELEEDETDILDVIDIGRTVGELLEEVESDTDTCLSLANDLGLTELLEHGFRSLSTGETRKLLLARAILAKPKLLLLHDPYEGIDAKTRPLVDNMIRELAQRGTQVLFMVDRPADLPLWITQLAIFCDSRLCQVGSTSTIKQSPEWLALTLCDVSSEFPKGIVEHKPLADDEPIIELRHTKVSYADNVVFDDLNWRIAKGEHWRVLGANGTGKTTLLNLICGDHPQCYSNWIRQFGMQRGQGESIWEIKQHIGLVNAELQLNYRVRVNVITAVVSGFFDSIGVYKTVSLPQKQHAKAWLEWFHIGHLANVAFHDLSYGQQRLVLIIRALVKSPAILILDEPLQGLDEVNAQLVLAAVNRIIAAQASQILYVSHRDEPGLDDLCKILDLNSHTSKT